MINFILENTTKIGVAVLCAALIHIMGVALTCLLARSISKANYEEIRWGHGRGQDHHEKKAAKSGHIRENSSFEEQKQPLTSNSGCYQQANNANNAATSVSGGSGSSVAAVAEYPSNPPNILPPVPAQQQHQVNPDRSNI